MPSIACSFADRSDDTRQVVVHLTIPESADQIPVDQATWQGQMDNFAAAFPSEWHGLSGVGDVAYFQDGTTAHPARLFFRHGGATAQIETSVPDSMQRLVEIAQLIESPAARIGVRDGRQSRAHRHPGSIADGRALPHVRADPDGGAGTNTRPDLARHRSSRPRISC